MELKSILIVDDSDSDHFINVDVIEGYNANIEILQAYDGSEALEILEKRTQPPTIILLDINMPGMDGFEFLEHYNTKPVKSKVIAMLTSSSQSSDHDKTKKYECVKAYIEKPLSGADLTRLISELDDAE